MERAIEAEQRWQLLETLFHRAMDLPVTERVGKAREWCRDDPQMLTLLLEMFVSDSSIERLLASTAASAYQVQRRLADGLDQPDQWIGKVLGPFHVERLLGRGGMGVVYFGRRITGGFTQSVAIKMIARDLSGGPAVQQFHWERDALAKLDHKNIARLLDAGITTEGTPYVAMEYVDGRRFDDVCSDPTVSYQEKLQWMLQLCDAVAYVHRNLILHRDLKPGNVMVTSDGVVKLLDFGTLKLIGPVAALSSEMTQAGMRPMTLRYASPEHIAGKTVSTATDVYSLGMILYKIIAGRLPKAIDAASLSEHIETLRNAELEPPSSHRNPDQPMPRLFAKDLDAITLKAVRFEPEQRYQSAEDLAADIRLCLEQRPIKARRGTRRYMATKFYVRNRIAVLGTAAVLLTLGIALTWMRHEASIARNEQRRAESRIQEERKLAHLLLFDYFTQLQDIPGSISAQRQAVNEAIRYLDELTRSSQSSELQLDVVQAYQKMGLLLGSPYVANLGDAPAAINTLQKATVLSQHLLRLNPQDLDYRVAFMDVQKAMAQAYFAMKQPEKALAILLPAAEMARSIAKDPHANGKMLNQCGALLKTLADTYGQHANGATGNFDKAVDSLQQAGVMYRASVDRGSQLYTGPVISYLFLGVLLRSVDIDQSIEMFDKALDLIAALPVAEQAKLSMVRLRQTCQEKLGGIYLSLGRQRDADLVLGATRSDSLHAIAVDPIDTRARDDLIAADTTILNATPITNTPATRELMQEYLNTTEWLVRNHPGNNAWQYVHAEALLNFAKLYIDLGDDAAAAPYIARGLPEILSIAKQPDADAETLSLAAEALLFSKRDPIRDPILAVAFAESAIANTHPSTPDQLITLAKAQRAAGQHKASQTSTMAAEALLKAHPNSYKNAEESAEARRLLVANQ